MHADPRPPPCGTNPGVPRYDIVNKIKARDKETRLRAAAVLAAEPEG